MSILNKNVRRRGGDLFDELKSAGEQPLKIVPVRFPIAEETYEIVQVVNEPMGMVERYVLEAISEFGPCDYTDIHNLLGLDTGLIGDMVEDLIKAGVEISRDGVSVTSGERLRDSIRKQTLDKRLLHRRTFVVNPFTGDLLPITFINDSSRWLVPFVTDKEESESSDWLRIRIGDRAINGRRSVVEALSCTDIQRREQIGIPEGAIELGDETCLDRKLYSALAFAVLTRDKRVEVYSAADFAIRLTDQEAGTMAYWNLACNDSKRRVFNEPKSIEETAAHFIKNREGVECFVVDEQTLAIKLQCPEKVLCVDSRQETSESGAMNMLKIDLVNGWFWNVKDFSVWSVIAGDVETESRLIVLRGIKKLRELYRSRALPNSLILTDWWLDFQSSSTWRLRREAGIQAIELDKFLDEAEQVPDTRFLDWLEGVATPAGGDT